MRDVSFDSSKTTPLFTRPLGNASQSSRARNGLHSVNAGSCNSINVTWNAPKWHMPLVNAPV